MEFIMGRREGSYCWNLDGTKRLLNCHLNGGTFNLGHRHPALVKALQEATATLDIGNHHFVSAQRTALAERLADLAPGDIQYTVFGVSGGMYPITATCLRPHLMEVFRPDPFIHISTFGGAEIGFEQTRADGCMSEASSAEDDLARTLLALEAHYRCKERLARALRHRGATPADLRPLWNEVAQLNGQLLRLDHSQLRALAKSILRRRDATQCRILFHMVLDEYRKVIRFNRKDEYFRIGIDGQIPNWVVRDYPGDDAPLQGHEGLWFIDTNTPMMRTGSRECLPLSFYLRGLPRLIRPLIRPLAKSVLDRYFNPRTILLDFLANVSIHGRPDLMEGFLPDANDFLAEGLIEPAPAAITKAEVERYIKHDVATWRLLRASRQIEALLEGRQGPVTTFRAVREIYRRPLFEE